MRVTGQHTQQLVSVLVAADNLGKTCCRLVKPGILFIP